MTQGEDPRMNDPRMQEARAFFDEEVRMLRQLIRWGDDFYAGGIHETMDNRLARMKDPGEYSAEPLSDELIEHMRFISVEVDETADFIAFVELFASRYGWRCPEDVKRLWAATHCQACGTATHGRCESCGKTLCVRCSVPDGESVARFCWRCATGAGT